MAVNDWRRSAGRTSRGRPGGARHAFDNMSVTRVTNRDASRLLSHVTAFTVVNNNMAAYGNAIPTYTPRELHIPGMFRRQRVAT